tara:strand:- start:229 stop:1737 length:1509 start_codon:yes stop_codon:yes gene_type:complete
MAKQTINIGSSANDGTGDPLRTAFDKINDNFDELYSTSLTERVSLDTSPQLGGNLDVVTHSIVSTTNRDIVLAPHGTGAVKASSLKFLGTSISSDDSTMVQINEGLNVSGATTLSTSLALATGATVTGVDNGALGSSATLLATQGAIKTYVDSQVTAQDLDLAGDSGTGAVDLDSQSLTIAGGTGITSVAGSQTVTMNIDATVATLSGSQTLTNKVITAPTINGATMTGPVTIDTITFDNNIIKSNASNADLELNGNGTGQVRILPNATVVGTLNTASIATTGTHTITGQADIDAVRIKDNSITTNASNANLELSANGTGIINIKDAMTTVGQTITGNVVIDGRIDVDNIAISGNGIIATNSGGGINLNPNATGQVTIGGSVVSVPAMLAATDINVTSSLFLGAGATITTNVSNADINIEADGVGSVLVDQVRIKDNLITTSVSNADLQLDTDGTGFIDIRTDTQATVGSAGSASALPGQPTGYIKIKIAGTLRVIPFYDQA